MASSPLPQDSDASLVSSASDESKDVRKTDPQESESPRKAWDTVNNSDAASNLGESASRSITQAAKGTKVCKSLVDGYFNTLDYSAQVCIDWSRRVLLPLVPPKVLKYLDFLNRQFNGWRFGVIGCAVSVFIVLIINISYALWVYQNYGFQDGVGVIAQGDCQGVRHYSFVGHLIINVFGTILLSGSNYCMQCLCAPTRQDIDRAHARGRALDIGTQSFTNLFSINPLRSFAWLLLGLSSLPLHLMYNSVMYATIATNNYEVIVVNEAFTQDVPVNHTSISYDFTVLYGYTSTVGYGYSGYSVSSLDGANNADGSGPYFQPISRSMGDQTTVLFGSEEEFKDTVMRLHDKVIDGTLDRLNKEQCIDAYARTYLSDRSNLIIVAENPPFDSDDGNMFMALGVQSGDATGGDSCSNYNWMCSDRYSCTVDSCLTSMDKVRRDPEHWQPFGVEVKECLSEATESHCRLQISAQIIIIVIVFNICKAVIMCLLAFRLKETPILTVGDALATFLTQPDQTTTGSCLSSKYDFAGKFAPAWVGQAKEWSSQRIAWCRACTPWRWVWFIFIYIITLIVVIILIVIGINALIPANFDYAMSLGFGSVQSETLISSFTGGHAYLIPNILLTNCPQPILSLIYLAYNGIFTSMLAGLEWSRYAWHKKGLRVSRFPEGAQRTTYFLQLPYRYAFPIMILSAILHWLVSQSLFLVAIEPFNPNGVSAYLDGISCGGAQRHTSSCRNRSPVPGQQITIGYSPSASFATIMVGLTMLITAVTMGFRRYRVGMPLAGTSSAAISAACHLSQEEKEECARKGISPAMECVQWGVVSHGTGEKHAHCSFSTGAVRAPAGDGVLYA